MVRLRPLGTCSPSLFRPAPCPSPRDGPRRNGIAKSGANREPDGVRKIVLGHPRPTKRKIASVSMGGCLGARGAADGAPYAVIGGAGRGVELRTLGDGGWPQSCGNGAWGVSYRRGEIYASGWRGGKKKPRATGTRRRCVGCSKGSAVHDRVTPMRPTNSRATRCVMRNCMPSSSASPVTRRA